MDFTPYGFEEVYALKLILQFIKLKKKLEIEGQIWLRIL